MLLESCSTTNSAAIQGLAHSHNNIAATLNIKEQIASLQMEFAMYRELGDDGFARQCIDPAVPPDIIGGTSCVCCL
jgi:hypothetical protein